MTPKVAKSSALRIGLIVDSFVQPRWVRKSLEDALAADVSTLELVVKVPAKKNVGESLLYKLYNRIDRGVFGATPDALQLVSIEDLVGSLPSLQSEETDKIKALNLDVFIDFAQTDLKSKFAGLANYGVWFYVFGTDEKVPPGFRETLTQDPLTISSLKSLNGAGATERIIYQSVSPTLSRFSVGLNNNACYWKSAAFVARSLVDLYNGRHEHSIAVSQRSKDSLELTNAAVAQMIFKLSERAASRALEKLSSFEQWVLAYRINETEFKYLIPPSDRFWADPFPIRMGGRYFIFIEEYLYAQAKAHISVIEVDKKGIVSGPTEVLKQDCHLSYPFVFEWQGEFYMVPETGEKNVVELYRSVSFPFEWEREKILLEGNCPLDATLIEVKGRWWMFVNIQEQGVTVNWDELHLYYSESPKGPWKAHARNPIVSDVRSARPAGQLFWSNNILFRPSQDSTTRYGYGITINEVVHISAEQYVEKETVKILPTWDKRIIGVHTLNACGDLTVIDCLLKRRKFASDKPLAAVDIGIELANQGFPGRDRGLRACNFK